ncbi:MAG: carboxypeptidase regulatory-like domain-containing protein, partial [Bacteroidia bacterium]|nr:carboxypeptidase regulatory-like domain-containing protein [Bacteroidia bacterium]
NGGYSLKPVIRTIENAISGALIGKINQTNVIASVTASSGSNSYSTVTNLNGDFMLAGLPPGTYTVVITPPAPFNTVTINNIVITTGATTNIGTQNI